MKTFKKQVQQIGNISLIQFETLEGEGMAFLPAAPAMERGELAVKELIKEGAVNTLLAINPTDHYYLLTDMDLLQGARQNRVVNRSVLIAPRSKQEIGVSCVERSRWSYNSPTFKPGPEVMDTRMRGAKAESLRKEVEEDMDHHETSPFRESTQSKLWGLIRDEMIAHNLINETEDYTSVLDRRKERMHFERKFTQQERSNGVAVFDGRTLISFDIFGNRDAYRYYFEKLAGNALVCVKNMEKNDIPGEAEVSYRLDEFLDQFEFGLKDRLESDHLSIGSLRWSGMPGCPGFELDLDGQLVHMAGFSV